MADLYETLEVSRFATSEQIRGAYRRLVLRFHPDRAEGDRGEVARRFRDIQEAYEILSDPARRQRYDEWLSDDRRARRERAEQRAGARTEPHRGTSQARQSSPSGESRTSGGQEGQRTRPPREEQPSARASSGARDGEHGLLFVLWWSGQWVAKAVAFAVLAPPLGIVALLYVLVPLFCGLAAIGACLGGGPVGWLALYFLLGPILGLTVAFMEPAGRIIEWLVEAWERWTIPTLDPDRSSFWWRYRHHLAGASAALALAAIIVAAVVSNNAGNPPRAIAAPPAHGGAPTPETADSEPPSVAEPTVAEPTVEGPTPATAEPQPVASREPRPSLTDLEATYFRVQYPAGWLVRGVEESRGSYLDTTIHEPGDPQTLIRIDLTPGFRGTAAEGAAQVREAIRELQGYRELRFVPTSFRGDRRAVWWEWTVIEKGVRVHKIDVFFVTGGVGYAILTQAPARQWKQHAPLFNRVRTSLQPKTPPPPSEANLQPAPPRPRPENLPISAADRRALREAFLLAHPQYKPAEIAQPAPNTVRLGRYDDMEYAFATFVLPDFGTVGQPEIFSRERGGTWIDLGTNGGEICPSRVPLPLLKKWNLERRGGHCYAAPDQVWVGK